MSAVVDWIERNALGKVAARPEERESFWRKLNPEQSLEMERSHLWVRVSIMILPLALLFVFGPAAAQAAIICAICIFGSYSMIWGLLRFWPEGVRRGQIGLRLLDVALLFAGILQVQIVLLRQTGSVTDVFDMLYALTIMSSVANSGLRGGLVLTGASSAAILLDRLLLLRLGLLRMDAETPGQLALSIVTYAFMFAVTSSTVFYLMQVSAMLAARRERALSAVIADDNVKLEAANSELERANDALRARRRLMADIAHDLRSPLTVINGYAQAMADGMVSPTLERLATLRHQAERLNQMIGDLRLLSLADIGALPLTLDPVYLEETIKNTIENFALAAEQKELALSCAIDGELPPIQGDAPRLEQVLGNLVSNALRHTPPGGAVRLTARAERQDVVLTVEDTGEGIAPEELPLVFDRLYRAGPEATRDAAGSGLGLAIVRSLVSAHSGQITVVSALGKGTTFTIRLPVQAQQAALVSN